MSIKEHQMEASPQVLARIGGALYLINILLGVIVQRWQEQASAA